MTYLKKDRIPEERARDRGFKDGLYGPPDRPPYDPQTDWKLHRAWIQGVGQGSERSKG